MVIIFAIRTDPNKLWLAVWHGKAGQGNRFPHGQSIIIITWGHLGRPTGREGNLLSEMFGENQFCPGYHAYRPKARKRRQRGSKKVRRDVSSGDGPLDRPKNKACNSIETSHRHRGNSTWQRKHESILLRFRSSPERPNKDDSDKGRASNGGNQPPPQLSNCPTGHFPCWPCSPISWIISPTGGYRRARLPSLDKYHRHPRTFRVYLAGTCRAYFDRNAEGNRPCNTFPPGW